MKIEKPDRLCPICGAGKGAIFRHRCGKKTYYSIWCEKSDFEKHLVATNAHRRLKDAVAEWNKGKVYHNFRWSDYSDYLGNIM